MVWRVALVIAVSAICGLVGGIADFLLRPPTSDQLSKQHQRWWLRRAMVLGAVAAFVVPLFLKLAETVVESNNSLLKQILSEDGRPENWFVYAGFCLVAAASASHFLTTVTSAVLRQMQQDIKEAKHTARDAEERVDDLESDLKAPPVATAEVAVALPVFTRDELLLLRNMNDLAIRRIRRPSPSDISRASGLSDEAVGRLLAELQKKGYVQRRDDAPDGTERWRIRTQGKAVLEQLGNG